VKKDQVKAVEETKQEGPVTSSINYEHQFAKRYLNKVMLSPYTMEFYNLDPNKQLEEGDGEKDYSNIVWVQVEDEIEETADKLGLRMSEFGDFNVFKDSQTSFFMEFYFIEPDTIPSQSVLDLIAMISKPEHAKRLGIKAIVPYKEANKFKAHNRLE
jgi:hypothetical protein